MAEAFLDKLTGVVEVTDKDRKNLIQLSESDGTFTLKVLCEGETVFEQTGSVEFICKCFKQINGVLITEAIRAGRFETV